MHDPNLNETGRINLGDAGELQRPENVVKLFGADGKVRSSATKSEKQSEAEKLAKNIYRSGGVSWHLDESETEKQGKDMFFPRLCIEGLSEKFGISRPHQEFFPNERNMIIQAFMNDCSEYLFGVEAFNEINTSDGLVFRPNPEWVRLPVKKQ